MKSFKICQWLVPLALFSFIFTACEDEGMPNPQDNKTWVRSTQNPILTDPIPAQNYQVASDGHVFFDEEGQLHMIYSGDVEDRSSIKLAKGSSWSNWEVDQALLFEPGPSNLDIHKETSFYRKSADGKHQIYYIGYDVEEEYKAQIFLAEADELTGPYTQNAAPVVSRGNLAGKSVYCMTSPSIVEHEGFLHLSFIGWNASPSEVTEVWVIGALSNDEGRSWSNFRIVDTPIGMEGQLTKRGERDFVAVRTGVYRGKEAIFYARAEHPFGPWETSETPILSQDDTPYEKNEVIAPQITIDPSNNKQYLYYTGADHQVGWWMMLASLE